MMSVLLGVDTIVGKSLLSDLLEFTISNQGAGINAAVRDIMASFSG